MRRQVLHHCSKMSLFLAALLMVFSSTAFGSQQSARDNVDKQRVTDLRIVPGKQLIEGGNNIPAGPLGLLTYRLEEVALPQPIEIQRFGKKQRIETAIRLTITGKSVWTARVIWIDDARLTGIWSDGPDKIGTLIYDRSILKPGAALSVQDAGGIYSLPEPLKLPQTFVSGIKSDGHEGNEIVGIRSALRIVGSLLQPLVQIELRTNRPFPVRNAALQVQIGKQFFLNELGSDTSGRSLIVSLTPQVFAALKDGAEVLAGFSFDRSGARSEEIWYFGRLNKNVLDK